MASDPSIENGIIRQITDGSITIDAVDEFESILKIFPENPDLRRLYADLLTDCNRIDNAVNAYHESAQAFLAAGEPLRGIVAEIIAWRHEKPDVREMKRFYNRLLECNPCDTPLKQFIGDLSMPELFTLISRMQRIRVPSKRILKKPGDPEKALYLIVTGAVVSKGQPDASAPDADASGSRQTVETEFFGEVCPVENLRFSRVTTETTKPSELVIVSKENLSSMVGLFPSFSHKLKTLFHNRHAMITNGRRERGSKRQAVPVRIKVAFNRLPGEWPGTVIRGTVKDMSVGGVSVLLDQDSASVLDRSLGQETVELEMSLPSEALTVTVRGRIIWEQSIVCESVPTRAIGIQFDPLPPNLSGLLLVFAGDLARLA